jgi:hypothetical protein
MEEVIPGALESEAILSITGTAADDVWVVKEGRKILHFDGRKWSEQKFPEMRAGWLSIYAAARNDVWASGNYGYIGHFDGTRWTVANLDAAKNGKPIDGIQSYFDIPYVIAWPGEVWVPSAHVRKTATGWSAIPQRGLDSALARPWGTSVTSIWSDCERLMHFDGVKWAEVRPSDLKDGETAWMRGGSADNDLWIERISAKDATRSHVLLHYDGERFVETPLPHGVKPGWMFAQSQSKARSNAWMSDSRGALLKWNGKEWRWSPHGDKRWQFYALWAPPGGKAVAVGFPGDRILREK